MDKPNPEWLLHRTVQDEGLTRALFPYSLFRSILTPHDCRSAVVNETAALEQELGASVVQPFYDLLWRFNTVPDVFTSHATVSPPDRQSPFQWAKALIGSAVIMLPRNQNLRHELRVSEGMASMLSHLLANSSSIPKDTTGWQIQIYPVAMNLLYDVALANDDRSFVLEQGAQQRDGYGHEIVISGSAGTRQRAAERWSRAVQFVLDTVKQSQSGPPFDYFAVAQTARDAMLGPQ